MDVLQQCAALQRAEIFDFVLTFCEEEKEAASLIWAAGGGSSIDHLLSDTIQIKHAQHALLVAIRSGQLNHVKILLEPAQGMTEVLHPLWLAIYHKKMDIFNYLLTTPWLPKEHVQQWEQGWDDMLIAAATHNVPECVPQLLAHGADPKSKRCLAMRFAGKHADHLVFDLLYPLYPPYSIMRLLRISTEIFQTTLIFYAVCKRWKAEFRKNNATLLFKACRERKRSTWIKSPRKCDITFS